MNKLFSTALLASALVIGFTGTPLVSSPVFAAGIVPMLSNGQQLGDTGRIDSIDLGHDAILIDDRGFTIPQDVSVHGTGGPSSRSALHKGATVRFSYYYDGPRPVITEVWLTTR